MKVKIEKIYLETKNIYRYISKWYGSYLGRNFGFGLEDVYTYPCPGACLAIGDLGFFKYLDSGGSR